MMLAVCQHVEAAAAMVTAICERVWYPAYLLQCGGHRLDPRFGFALDNMESAIFSRSIHGALNYTLAVHAPPRSNHTLMSD